MKPRRIRQPSDPDVLAQEVVEDIEAALGQFREIAADLRANSVSEQRSIDHRVNFNSSYSA